MSQFIVPLAATPSQTLTVRLDEQPCRINLYQKSTGLYFDLYVQDVAIINGRICLNRVPLVLFGFAGDLFFVDTAGNSDPTYDGLGARYLLIYDDTL